MPKKQIYKKETFKTGESQFFMKLKSPVGELILIADNQALLRVSWENEDLNLNLYTKSVRHPILVKAKKQLVEYFKGKRKVFDLPIRPHGTEFQKKAWSELVKIPFGKTLSYGEQAKRLGRPKSFRAVGAANGKNPLGIIIPCHRVVSANGHLNGFAGGLNCKRQLLILENNKIEYDFVK